MSARLTLESVIRVVRASEFIFDEMSSGLSKERILAVLESRNPPGEPVVFTRTFGAVLGEGGEEAVAAFVDATLKYSEEGKSQQQELGEQGQQMMMEAMKKFPDNLDIVINAASAWYHVVNTQNCNSLTWCSKTMGGIGIIVLAKALTDHKCHINVNLASGLLRLLCKLAVDTKTKDALVKLDIEHSLSKLQHFKPASEFEEYNSLAARALDTFRTARR